ncbi:MAG: D-2-hydroxyacid dehydrogenase family protein [Candidatus Puniceispirillum sp.]
MKIAVLDDWLDCAKQSADWDRLGADVAIDFFQDTVTGSALVNRLQPYDILCVMRERSLIDAALIAQLPNLKAIVTSGMRNAAIDLDAAKARNITVCGTGSPGHATAELAFILIGMLARQILPGASAMRDGGWQTHLGRDLRGARLGILGLGRLGGELAGFAKAFGMEVQAWSQNLTNERCAELNVTYADRETLFRTSDFISIHLKLSDRVKHLVGASELDLMKPDACLVNTSRASIIDMEALITALTAGQIGGAAIDVYDLEPVPENDPLRNTPNLLMTPHIGYVTRETMTVFYRDTLDAIASILSGQPIRQL